MRPVWTRAISFGLVNIPINLMSAEDPSELKFNLMDAKDHARIKYQRVNADTGKEVAWEDIVKAYEFPDGSYVIVTDEDFAKADLKASKTFEIEQFVGTKELNPMYLEKPYYVTPVKGGEKPYILLRDAMKLSGKAAIGRVTLRTKQSMGVLLPVKDALVLILLRYAEEVRNPEGLKFPADAKISAKEMELAMTLIDGLTKPWDPEEFKDEYSGALLSRIEAKAKLKGAELPDDGEAEAAENPSNVVDILELLKKSVETKGRQGSNPRSKGSLEPDKGEDEAASAEKLPGKSPAKSTAKASAKAPAEGSRKSS